VGARSVEQLNDSLGAVRLQLSPEQRAQLPAAMPGRWVGNDPVYDGAL
jgi:aryl-alcohol dehydrogenase-like predicted oxidoreductase